MPMLWVYTENGSYFAPALAKSMHHAFTVAGGEADLQQLSPFGKDGHALFDATGGSAIWGPLMDAYLGRESELPSFRYRKTRESLRNWQNRGQLHNPSETCGSA